MLEKRWLVRPAATKTHLRKFKGLNPILAQILINRGYEQPEEAERFLYNKATTHDPFLLIDMDKAVERIRFAINKKQPMAVYGDFDADGVTSTTLLVEALRAFGGDVIPYIPIRADEGYGLNTPALKHLAGKGIKLVITVDCGIRSVEEVRAGSAAGLDIIITDHHSLGPELPDALAVINPKRGRYPDPHLAGVGVSFKLVQALIMRYNQLHKLPPSHKHLGKSDLQISDLMDLVAIGTVADLMSLRSLENRVLVRRGLEILNADPPRRLGLRALYNIADIKPGNVTTTTIGFTIGPRINAAGRLDNAMIAYDLLSATTEEQAKHAAERLQQLNAKRQDITRETHDFIRGQIDESAEPHLIFAADEKFEPGIVGLVAGRLTEEFFRPSIVMEKGADESRASCRSIPQFDITQALDQCADLLVRHGGHALAAGFTVKNENIQLLHQRLLSLAERSLGDQPLIPTLDIDAEIDIHQINAQLIEDLQMLEPCGHHNPTPLFCARGVHVYKHRTVGSDSRHLKLELSRASQPPLEAIAFGFGAWSANMPEWLDIVFELEMNEWNGQSRIQAMIRDLKPAQVRQQSKAEVKS